MTTDTKQPYTSPRFERYGNVRDLTHSAANAKNTHADGATNTTFNVPGKTH